MEETDGTEGEDTSEEQTDKTQDRLHHGFISSQTFLTVDEARGGRLKSVYQF